MPTALAAPQALLGIEKLSQAQAQIYIEKAFAIKSGRLSSKLPPHPVPNVALIFFEASTRTRFSFEMAARKLGLNTVSFVADATTSVSKGESQHETLNTLIQMHPDMLVVRHSGDAQVAQILKNTSIPVINAGDGKGEHPTQALLDAMTILERLEIKNLSLKDQKIIFVGDVEHSRVARSGRLLFQLLGAEVAICCPSELAPQSQDWQGVKHFTEMAKATAWATVCMGLRLQKERHGQHVSFSQEEYIANYRLDDKNLKNLSKNALIMHPGPFVPGIDLDEKILADSRCVIHQQVENGVLIRMAVIGEIFGLFGA